MADLFLRSTDGLDTDNGSTWALAKEQSDNVDGVTSVDAAGDTIYVSDNHAESQAANIIIELAGTNDNPVDMLCVDDTGDPASPSSLAETATITSTTGEIDIKGAGYIYGHTFSAYSNLDIGIDAQGSNKNQTYKNCVLKLNRTGSSTPGIRFNDAGGSTSGKKTLKDCKIYKATNSQGLTVYSGLVHFMGLTLASGSLAPLDFIKAIGTNARSSGEVLAENCDFTSYAASFDILTTLNSGIMVVRNSKLPASWTGSLLAGSVNGCASRISMYNCDDGDTNYRLWIEAYAGSIKHETTLVRTGGASDGTTGLSWKLESNANANEHVSTLETDEIVRWNETVGTAITATVEILHDSVTDLQDDEIWMEVQYLGTSGFPLGLSIDDKRADILTAAANQTTSTEAWTTTGMTNPNKQKLSVTFTPQEKGYIHAKVHVGKVSYTVYVCPKIDIT